jgi:hypothetical protein
MSRRSRNIEARRRGTAERRSDGSAIDDPEVAAGAVTDLGDERRGLLLRRRPSIVVSTRRWRARVSAT